MAARQNDDLLFVVNTHPVERQHMRTRGENIYQEMIKGVSNIIYVEEAVDAIALMQHIGCVVHIGTSGLYGAYISCAKSLELDLSSFFDKLSKKYSMDIRTGFPSTLYADIYDLCSVIINEKDNFKDLDLKPAYDDFLFRAVNYKRGEEYKPSMLVAQAILDTERFGYQAIETSEMNMFYLSKLMPSPEQSNSEQPSSEQDILPHEEQGALLGLIKKCIVGTPLEFIARKIYTQLKNLR